MGVINIKPTAGANELKSDVKKLKSEIDSDISRIRADAGKKGCHIDKHITSFRNTSRKIGAAEAMLDLLMSKSDDRIFVSNTRRELKLKEEELAQLIKKVAEGCKYGASVYTERWGESKEVYKPEKKKSSSEKKKSSSKKNVKKL